MSDRTHFRRIGNLGAASRMRRFWAVFLGLPVLLASTIFANAHPHEFVEMKVEIHFNNKGRASSMKYSWLFDEFFSAYAIEPADKNGDGKPEQEGLDALILEILDNIEEINYFTKFRQSGHETEFGAPKPILAKMKKRQLYLEFELPFKQPLDLRKKELGYAIYDGEFYIAMNHSTDADAVKFVGAPKGCKFDITRPNPSEDLAAFANSLNKTQSGGAELGAGFAEWVTIKCQ